MRRDRDPATRRLQHARQPVRLERRRERLGRSCGGRPLRRLQPDERRLPSRAPCDGRRAARRDDAAVRAARRGPGLQQHPPHDPAAELPRAAARPPRVPALRARASEATAAATARISPGRSGGTGRRTGLKIRRLKGRGGSIPPFGIAPLLVTRVVGEPKGNWVVSRYPTDAESPQSSASVDGWADGRLDDPGFPRAELDALHETALLVAERREMPSSST